VQAVLSAESIQPHRFRYWKHSPDPEFEPKMLAVIGLYMQPPQNGRGVILSLSPSARLIPQTGQTIEGGTAPPFDDHRLGDLQRLLDLFVAASGSCQQHDTCSQHIPLRGQRRADYAF
jgi:hypothetical protein